MDYFADVLISLTAGVVTFIAVAYLGLRLFDHEQ